MQLIPVWKAPHIIMEHHCKGAMLSHFKFGWEEFLFVIVLVTIFGLG
jgi:hypothetical protein